MQPNNIFFSSCPENLFYRVWLEFLTPYHKMSAREKDVAARILLQYFTLKNRVQDPSLLQELLFSAPSKNDMRESLGMSKAHFQMKLAALREARFLLEHDEINPKYLPHRSGPKFFLGVVIDSSSEKNPVTRVSE